MVLRCDYPTHVLFEADGRRLKAQVQMKSPSLICERWAFLWMIGSTFRAVVNYCFPAIVVCMGKRRLFLQLAVHEIADQ